MKSYIKPVLLLVLAASMSITGCLKDKDFDNGVIQSVHTQGDQSIIELSLTATSTDNFLNIALDAINRDTTFDLIPVTLASGSPAKEDINVTLTANAALIGNYNALNGTVHEEAPSSLYTITNPAATGGGYVVTIPRGSNVGYLKIKIRPSNYLGFDYALGFLITSISPSGYTIGTNFSYGVVAIGIKNEWDGIYTYKGYSLRAGDATLTGNFSGQEMALVTSGATSVKFGDLALWGDGNSGIAIGNVNLAMNTSGPSPYPVTITSSGGAYNDPSYTSVYDVPTKTFFVSYSWGAGPASRLSTDTLTYDRPR